METDEIKELPAFADLVSGTFETVPSQESSTVRVFLSSTFTDMMHERNRLLREIYPKLQRYCQMRGMEFEVVDMRWGVHDNITTDHKTTHLCMVEIDNCKRLSQGPCFVAFLGNKYGYRPLTASIAADVFEKLCELMEGVVEPTTLQLVKDWYRKDLNSVPPVYILQPITSKFHHFDDENDTELRQEARDKWWRDSQKMQEALKQGAAKAVKQGIYSQDNMQHFFSSVTEQEVVQALKDNPNPEENVLIFVRHMEGVESSSEPIKRRFIDLDENGDIKTESQELLNKLKTSFLPSKLPASSIHQYQIPWRPTGVDPNFSEHAQYLIDITQQFYDSMVAMIDKRLCQRSKVKSAHLKAFYEELLHHSSFRENKCRSFRGRDDIFEAVEKFLEIKSSKPCVIHGISGSGKTSVMAMIAKRAKNFIKANVVCVLRFLGTSTLSSSIRDTLLSVCQQICFAYNLQQPTKTDTEDFHKLDMFFKSLLVRAPTSDRPLLLLLDSIDQLSSKHNAYSMNWLPLTCSKDTYIIVSMLPKINNCLMNIQKLLKDEDCYVEMTPVKQNLGLEIMDGWLELQGRLITEEQRELVSAAILNCPQPLYLKILFEEFSRWPSYKHTDGIRLPGTVREALTQLFEDLERKHGDVLVSHALGYLSAGRQGLTDGEIRDVLSCDDEVLNAIYQYWDPPEESVIRIPPSVWKRIRFDIEEFLAERQAGGKNVVAWYHRQFIEAGFDRYLADSSAFHRRHALLSDMYLDVYCEGKINPIELTMRGKHFPKADRQVAPQPLEFGEDIFNLRKLQELPYHLSCSADADRLNANVIYNFDWLYAKLRSCSFVELISDFEMMDLGSSVLKEALLMSRSSIQADPNVLACQLIARIGDLREESPELNHLLEQCEEWTAKTTVPLFVPRSVFLQPPGGPMVTSFAGHPSRVLKVAASEIHQVMISACEDERGQPLAYLWDIETYELIQDVHVPNITESGLGSILLEVEPRGDHFVFGSQQLKLFSVSNGDEIFSLECGDDPHDGAFAAVEFFKDTVLGLRKSSSEVFVWDRHTGSLIRTLEHPAALTHICLASSASAVTACQDGTLTWWSLDTMVPTHSAKVIGSCPCTDLISSCGGEFVLFGGDDGSLQLWTSEGSPPEPDYIFPVHTKPVSRMYAFKEDIIAVGYFDGTLKFWELSSKQCLKSVKEHRKEITCFATYNQGDVLIAGSLDDRLSIWRLDQEEFLNKLDGHSSWIADVAAIEDQDGGCMIFSASNDKSVVLWNPDAHLVYTKERHLKQPDCLVVSRDGHTIFSGSMDGTIKCWDFSSARCMFSLEGMVANSLLLVDSDKFLIAGLQDGKLKMFNVEALDEVDLENAHGKKVTFLNGCMEDARFISGSHDTTVKIWEDGNCLMTLEGHTDTVMDGNVTTDGRGILVSGATNGEVKFWDADGQCVVTGSHCKGLERVVISHNNQYVCTGAKIQTLIVWSLVAESLGSQLKEISLSLDSLKGLAFTHDDRFILSGTHTGKQQLHKWDFMKEDSPDTMYFHGHTHAVMWLYITTNDEYLITSSRDCFIKAWDLTSGQILATFNCACQIKHFAVVEVCDGHYKVVAANKTGVMGLFDLYLGEVQRVPHLRESSGESLKMVVSGNGKVESDIYPAASEFHPGPAKLRTKMSKKSKLCEVI
ncbi:NACHT domain- and WD repeat-containing protein 1 [Holothuria leucospilota]|uniref:NACHT domain- and WD repeat-containing protein 1 n=1 Tax=Holothuria leucospilota TaxID=206669 RepID=A0A9Q0YG71_HOLLE|nr:NACHT domain- and WD repeat-containing protein 1 [Holothuria leucospilota]